MESLKAFRWHTFILFERYCKGATCWSVKCAFKRGVTQAPAQRGPCYHTPPKLILYVHTWRGKTEKVTEEFFFFLALPLTPPHAYSPRPHCAQHHSTLTFLMHFDCCFSSFYWLDCLLVMRQWFISSPATTVIAPWCVWPLMNICLGICLSPSPMNVACCVSPIHVIFCMAHTSYRGLDVSQLGQTCNLAPQWLQVRVYCWSMIFCRFNSAVLDFF